MMATPGRTRHAARAGGHAAIAGAAGPQRGVRSGIDVATLGRPMPSAAPTTLVAGHPDGALRRRVISLRASPRRAAALEQFETRAAEAAAAGLVTGAAARPAALRSDGAAERVGGGPADLRGGVGRDAGALCGGPDPVRAP